MIYLFRTTATMKEYNRKKWWIASDIIPDMEIDAQNLNDALKVYRNNVQEKHYISISPSALRNKNAMYIDTKNGTQQNGYVITAKSEFDNGRGRWVDQYIDLWVDISILQNLFEGATI